MSITSTFSSFIMSILLKNIPTYTLSGSDVPAPVEKSFSKANSSAVAVIVVFSILLVLVIGVCVGLTVWQFQRLKAEGAKEGAGTSDDDEELFGISPANERDL